MSDIRDTLQAIRNRPHMVVAALLVMLAIAQLDSTLAAPAFASTASAECRQDPVHVLVEPAAELEAEEYEPDALARHRCARPHTNTMSRATRRTASRIIDLVDDDPDPD